MTTFERHANYIVHHSNKMVELLRKRILAIQSEKAENDYIIHDIIFSPYTTEMDEKSIRHCELDNYKIGLELSNIRELLRAIGERKTLSMVQLAYLEKLVARKDK